MRNIKLLIVVLLLSFVACTSSTDPVVYSMPPSLQGNAKVETYLNSYAVTGGEIISCSQKLSDGLGFAEMAKVSIAMSKASTKLEKIKAKRSEIELDLNDKQKADLDKTIYRIDASIGQMHLNIHEIDESEIAANRALKSQHKSEIDSVEALRLEAIAQMEANGILSETESSSNEIKMPKFMHILFPILIIGAFIAIGYFTFIKNIRNKVSEVGYAVGEAKDKYAQAKEKIKKMEAEGKELTEEQKKAFEFLDKHLKN